MPPWGGEFALDLLPLIAFERLRPGVPKWFCGFSDLSTIQLPMLLNAGWASLHGPNLMELATPTELGASVWNALCAPPGGLVTSTSSKVHQRGYPDWATDPRAQLTPLRKTRWRRLDGLDLPIHLGGRLLGGCLDTLSRIAGSPFGNVPGFIADHAHEGVLLFLENAEMRPTELARALMSLRLHGWFDGISGLLFGRNGPSESDCDVGFTWVDALERALDGLSIPVLVDLDIGHVPPQSALIQGAITMIEYNGQNGRFTQWVK